MFISNGDNDMTHAEFTTEDRIVFNGIRQVGFAKSLKPTGHEASPTTNPKYQAVFYTTLDPAFPDRRHVFNGPAYISATPSDHKVNPEFIAFIERVIEK
jgi:hypothetical protein